MTETPDSVMAPCEHCGKMLEWWHGEDQVCSPCNNEFAQVLIQCRDDIELLSKLAFQPAPDDDDPSDEQRYNGHGMEGGIAYTTGQGEDA